MTYYMRTSILREKSRDYVAAAQMLGASTPRIIFNHLLPNTISTIVTFMPFTVATAIISITALDYLGLVCRPVRPVQGRMLQQGVANLHARGSCCPPLQRWCGVDAGDVYQRSRAGNL